jgi:phospholipase/lecithinase/hemolysin
MIRLVNGDTMRRVWLVLVILVGFSIGAVAAQKRPYTMLYVFGDSYSDTGAGYVDGNGPTAVAYLAKRLEIPFTYFGDPNSKGKGLNFAVSGGQSGLGDGQRFAHGELLGRGMRNQVDDFAALVKSGKVSFDPKRTMFYLAGGLNDRRLADGVTVANLEGEIETLYGLGARRFEVALLPTKIPAFASAGTRFNPQLATIPAEMRAKHPNMQIANSDWGPFFDEVIEHPAKYGLTDVTNACDGRQLNQEKSNPCSSPETHFYYHDGHPSTAAHKAVGDLLYGEAMRAGK